MDDEQLKLEIAHFFSEDEVWVSKRDIFKLLGLGLTGGRVGKMENGVFHPYKVAYQNAYGQLSVWRKYSKGLEN